MAYNNLYAKNQLMAVLLENKKLKHKLNEQHELDKRNIINNIDDDLRLELELVKVELSNEKEYCNNLINQRNEIKTKNKPRNNMIMEIKNDNEIALQKKYDIKCKECEILSKGKDAYCQKNNVLTKIQNDQKKQVERLNLELKGKEAYHQKEIDRLSLENANLIREFSGKNQPEIIE